MSEGDPRKKGSLEDQSENSPEVLKKKLQDAGLYGKNSKMDLVYDSFFQEIGEKSVSAESLFFAWEIAKEDRVSRYNSLQIIAIVDLMLEKTIKVLYDEELLKEVKNFQSEVWNKVEVTSRSERMPAHRE